MKTLSAIAKNHITIAEKFIERKENRIRAIAVGTVWLLAGSINLLTWFDRQPLVTGLDGEHNCE